MTHNHSSRANHSHGEGLRLEEPGRGILTSGLRELCRMTEGMAFREFPSETYPLPLVRAVYRTVPSPEEVRRDVLVRAESDPVSVLEHALVLVELYESNQDDAAEEILEDMPLVRECFRSKRLNGWVATLGHGDRAAMASAVNARWQFKFVDGPPRPTGLYVLLNMLARYAFVYGRTAAGDAHAMAHFVEDHCPGLLVCTGKMTDLELTLSLAAMKLGVPAVVPSNYPLPLGRKIAADSPEEIAEAVVGFANIRRRLTTPDIPAYPDYCDAENQKETFEPVTVWGDTPESFLVVRKGPVPETGIDVRGAPGGPIGVTVTLDGEPLDALDRTFIERTIARTPSMIRGVNALYGEDRFAVQLAEGVRLDPRQLGEVLMAAVRREFPKLKAVHVTLDFDPASLVATADDVRLEKIARQQEIDLATEESAAQFCTCVGCSPFAPDHVCVLTPERPPQCGRPFARIKTGALYGYDDMSGIHHSQLHREINSFGVADKGRCLDAATGEWEGINAAVSQLSHGRTTRVQLHALDKAPHTGCGCFRLILFTTDAPRPGIGVMAAGYEGRSPDGRSWRDLHYALAGKQTPGVAGASPGYLTSPKFLRAHGGWQSVVWVDPKVAAIMGDVLPKDVEVGPVTETAE